MVGQSKKSVLCFGVIKKGMPYVTVSLDFLVKTKDHLGKGAQKAFFC